jgi:hypothetical protein
MFDRIGMAEGAKRYALGATRVQLQNKDSRGWNEFAAQMAGHSALGSANTLRGVQKQRPSLFDLVGEMKKITVPALVMTGDEDDPCIEASVPWRNRRCSMRWSTSFSTRLGPAAGVHATRAR